MTTRKSKNYSLVSHTHAHAHAHTHAHTRTHPFNGPFSRTTWVSQYQKGKTNLDFTEARDSEWQWHQLGHMQVCISLSSLLYPNDSINNWPIRQQDQTQRNTACKKRRMAYQAEVFSVSPLDWSDSPACTGNHNHSTPRRNVDLQRQNIAPVEARRHAPADLKFDLKNAADLCPSADGSAVRTSQVAGGG